MVRSAAESTAGSRVAGRAPRGRVAGRAPVRLSWGGPRPPLNLIPAAMARRLRGGAFPSAAGTAALRRTASIRGRRIRSKGEDAAEPGGVGKSGLLDVSILSETKWDVPWGGKVLAGGFFSWFVMFLGIGIFVAPALASILHLDFTAAGSPDDKAYFLLVDQTCELVAGLGLIWLITRPYAPLSDDLFKISFDDPFGKREGWLLWSIIGIAGGFAGVGITAYLLSLFNADPGGPNGAGTADAVASILSRDPKVFLSILTVTSVIAPLLEEVIFRGFLLTTLTKWLPAPAAALVSAAFFGAAHLTSKDFAQLTALGVVLGLTYVRTKNLATPMMIHSFWNSGVLLVLEALYLGGYDVTELISKKL